SCSSSYLAAVQLLSSNVVVTLCQCGQEGHLGDEKRRREGPNLHAGAMQGPGSQCPSSLRGPGEWRSRSQRLGRCPRGGGMGDHSPGAQSQGGDVTASDADTCRAGRKATAVRRACGRSPCSAARGERQSSSTSGVQRSLQSRAQVSVRVG
ncbi:unnamed protein product, partial [Effrenium voratum]